MLDFFSFSYESLETRASAEAPRAAAAEFPNDNTRLHRGARWLCLDPRGAARAVWRWSSDADPAGTHAQAELPASAQSVPALAALAPPAHERPAPVVLAHEPRLPRVMDIDPTRVILRNRVEDVPPPPEFVFKPFRRSPPPHAPLAALPGPIRVGAAGPLREVRRFARVDIAPCIAIGAGPTPPAAAPAPAARRSSVEPLRPRRSGSSRRGLAVSPLAEPEELRQAILDLEAAFGERAAVAGVL